MITHNFPSNYWRNKITKAKESDKCDLCKVLQISEGRFTTDDNISLCCICHRDIVVCGNLTLSRLCEGSFPPSQNLKNIDMDQEIKRPMTETEEERYKTGTPRKTITEARIWNKRPDGLVIKFPTSE